MSCLDDSTVLRFVTGGLEGKACRAVEEELRRCDRCAALVAAVAETRASAVASDAGSPTAMVTDAKADTAGDDEGSASRYVLGAEIARGGMGRILAAYDLRLDRTVAVKRLEGDTPSLVARFRREISVTASLQHPGIVPIYDSGTLPDGSLFYAMRYVPGSSMDAVMADLRDEEQRLDLLGSVLFAADAVAYAHEKGIIHRDLKPANILVGPFGEMVVIDWGLARVEGGDGVDDSAGWNLAADPVRTRDGSVLGTPRYMAPEQARGETATRRSDVYALGAILYHVLAGVPPVDGEKVSVVLEQVSRAEVVPLAKAAPALPADLAAIVDRAMAADPERRYASAGELAGDLRRFRAGQLVAAHSYSRKELVRRFVRRHRTAVALVSLFTAILTIGGVASVRGIISQRERAELQRHEAELQRHVAVRERAGAEALVQFLLYELRIKLDKVGRLDALSGVADRVESYYLTTAAGRAEGPDALRERASLESLRAAVAKSSGDGAAADKHLERGLELVGRTPPTTRADEVRAELLAGVAARATVTGHFDRARALRLESAAIYRRIAPDAPRRLDLLVRASGQLSAAAVMADKLGKVADADREWSEARATLERVRAEDPDNLEATQILAEATQRLGRSRYLRGLIDDSKILYEQALAEAEAAARRAPKDSQIHDVLTWTLLALGDIHRQRGSLTDADSLYRRAGEIAHAWAAVEPASAPWLRLVGRSRVSRGALAASRLDWAAATGHMEAGSRAYEQLVETDPRNREYRRGAAVALAQLAEAEGEFGRRGRARHAWLASLVHLASLAESGATEARLEWAYGLSGYAAFERRAGRLQAARKSIEHALSLIEGTEIDNDQHPFQTYRAGVLAELGFNRAARGRAREARVAWRRAEALLRRVDAIEALDVDGRRQLAGVQSALAASRPGRRSVANRE
jgi:tetratricopeptide (TPR) repeat protein